MDLDKKELAINLAAPVLKMALEYAIENYLDDLATFLIEKFEETDNQIDDLFIELLKKFA